MIWTTLGHLDCAHQCSILHQSNGGCNAFTFSEETCRMALLQFLEDPDAGDTAKEGTFSLAEMIQT